VTRLTTELLIEVLYAGGIGLLVGFEREHHEYVEDRKAPEAVAGEGAGHRETSIMGARTFALLSLFGWATTFGGELFRWLPVAGLICVAAIIVTQYVIGSRREQGIGLTTEVAAMLTFVLGMLVRFDRGLAVLMGLATTLLLVSKPWVRTVVSKLRRIEITATLQLLILLAIVLPLVPTEPIDPWKALPPRKICLFIILIAGISYIGYILSRIFGHRRGAGITGIVGGLTSSTAVTVAMAQTGKRTESMRRPGQLAVFLANTMMFARVIVVTAVLSRSLARELAVPMVAMGLVMLGGALWKWRQGGDDDSEEAEEESTAEDEGPTLENPFALIPALKWGLLLCAVLLGAVLARKAFGHSGLYAAAAASGLADVDAITLAVGKEAAEGALSIGVAALAITIAVVSNTIVKGGMAFFVGGRAFGADVVKVFVGSMLAGLAVAVGGLLL
jgi:uncharacterized membrane protein (DUF4010 family)